MVVFNHPQPALLFLVPGCTIAVLIKALIDGKLNDLFHYEEGGHKPIENTTAAETTKEVKQEWKAKIIITYLI